MKVFSNNPLLRIFFHPPWLPWQLAGWFSVGTCSAVKLASDAWAGVKRETVKYFINPDFIDDQNMSLEALTQPITKVTCLTFVWWNDV